MIEEDELRNYLGGDTDSDVLTLLKRAQTLINTEIGNSYVPEEIIDLATLQLCAELDQRRKNPGGIISYAGVDALGRLSKDPMLAVRPLLSAYVVRF